MKSFIAGLCALAVFAGGGVQAETAPAKPWTEADYAEKEAWGQRWLMPAMEAANAVSASAMTDPKAACAHAKAAQRDIGVGRADMSALDARIRAEGKDVTPLEGGQAMVDKLTAQADGMVKSVCAVRQSSGTPQQRSDDARIMGYMQRLSDTDKAVMTAMMNKDTATACARNAEAVATIDELSAFLGKLKVKYRSDAKAVAELKKMATDAAGWRVKTVERMADCPAG